MQKKKIDTWLPPESGRVRYKEAGGILEVTACSRYNNECYIRKLDKDHYMDVRTGEVFESQHIDSRADDKNSVRVSLSRLRDLINTNVTERKNVHWCVLTYKENMTDTKRLYDDFRKCVQRLRYYHEKQGLPPFEYIVAMEPQGRGAWHAHLLIIYQKKAPFIPNAVLAKIWGYGFVKIKSLKDIDNVGAYFTSYLSDIDISEETIPIGEVLHGKPPIKNVNGKRYIKGARLHLYPPNFKLYRISKGIKPPTVENTTEAQAMEKVGAATPTFERTVELVDPESNFSIVITKRYYNRNRKKCQEGEKGGDLASGH